MGFENRVLKKHLDKGQKVTGGLRKLHNEEFNDLHYTVTAVHYKDETDGPCCMNRVDGKLVNISVENLEGKPPLGGFRHRWKAIIKTVIKQMGF